MKLYLNNLFNNLDLSPFFKLFHLVFNETVELGTIEDSDILLESFFGSGTALYSKKRLYTFLFIGESDRHLPIYIENGINNPRIDEYSCVLKAKNVQETKFVNFPLFVFYLYSLDLTYRFKKRNYDENRFSSDIINKIKRVPPKDVCVIIPNEKYAEGMEYFLECLDKRVKVDYYKNKAEQDKCSPGFTEFVSQYKVVIAMENSKETNYITDCIVHGLAANAVPVYWGADNITDYFNEERFINVKSFIETDVGNAIDKIVEVLGDDNKFINIINKPIYVNNLIPISLTGISNNVRELLGIPNKQHKRFITFGGPTSNYHDAVIRICREAEALQFFDLILGYSELRLKNDAVFWEKHGEFIENNPRGYGYWIWKSYLIQSSLDEINDNDILIYCDAGCQINSNGRRRLLEYIDMLNTDINGYGLISFQLQFNEFQYTKQYVFDKFQSSEDEKNMLQCWAGIIIIKKNEHSVNIINEWYNHSQDCSLVDDNIANNEHPLFVENRHDQSILSVIVNKHGSVKLEDEAYFPLNWEYDGFHFPFWAKRLVQLN
jgi:hypothetical protein